MPQVQRRQPQHVHRAHAAQPRRASAGAVNTQLPASGKGFNTYGPRSMQYGTQRTVNSLQRIARNYNAATGKTMGIGDISKRNGGKTSRHATHQRGTDVDVRVPSRSGGGGTTWRNRNYDRNATRSLIREIKRENPNARILFNDPVLIRQGLTRPARGHDNHLHVMLR